MWADFSICSGWFCFSWRIFWFIIDFSIAGITLTGGNTGSSSSCSSWSMSAVVTFMYTYLPLVLQDLPIFLLLPFLISQDPCHMLPPTLQTTTLVLNYYLGWSHLHNLIYLLLLFSKNFPNFLTPLDSPFLQHSNTEWLIRNSSLSRLHSTNIHFSFLKKLAKRRKNIF